jgi:stalled ribosome rescue protein Dom34
MTAKTHAAVWLDHHEARVFHVDLEGFDEKTLVAPAHHFHREAREAALDDAHFFQTIAGALESAEEILVFGPSTGKRQFANWLDAHAPALAQKITHVDASDHPTDGQFVAEVRRHFRVPAPRIR